MPRTHTWRVAATVMLIGGCASGSEQVDEANENDSSAPLVTTTPQTTAPTDSTDGAGGGEDGGETSTTSPAVPETAPRLTLELAPTTIKAGSTASPAEPGVPEGFGVALFSDIDAGLTPFIERATADLAQRLVVAETAITTVSATLVTWPDASIGCPLPDMQYTQALQDGSLIELEHAATIYRYHSGGERVPFLCNARLAVPPANGSTADS